jgi:hypothetical protein
VGRRQEERLAHRVMVWVAGTDYRGNPFRQTAKITDISRLGARLAEIRCLRAAGELLELRSRGRKARFRVVWIDDQTGQAGIRCVEPSKNLWRMTFPPARPERKQISKAAAATGQQSIEAVGGWITSSTAGASRPSSTGFVPSTRREEWKKPASATPPPTPQKHERKHTRHRCAGGAEVRKEIFANQQERVWGRLTQISLGGCFVATMHPFAPQTKVTLFLGVQDLQLKVRGIICRAEPGVGMGIRFSELDERSQRSLEDLTANLSKGGRYSQFAS